MVVMLRGFSIPFILGAFGLTICFSAVCREAAAEDSTTELTVQPRVWHSMMSDTGFQNGNNATINSFKATSYELAGATAGIRNRAILGDITIALTALYGEGGSQGAGVTAGFPLSSSVKALHTGSRFDAEALAIAPVQEGATAFAGVRFIDWIDNYRITEIYVPEYDRRMKITSAYQSLRERDFLAEFGGGLSAPITDDNRHLLFANLTGAVGIRNTRTTPSSGPAREKTDWIAGVDANVGYAFQLRDDIKLSARYRVFLYSSVDHLFSNGNIMAHGPEVGLTYDLDRPVHSASLPEGDSVPRRTRPMPDLHSGTRFSFQPREWYAFLSDSYYKDHGIPAFDSTTAQRYPLSGGTIGIKDGDLLGDKTLAITAFYGQARASYSAVNTSEVGLSEIGKGYMEASRLDTEALLLIPSTERMNFFIGGRYIHWTNTYTLTQTSWAGITFPGSGVFAKVREDDLFAEAGGGATSRLSENGKHMVFANVVGMLGKLWTVAEPVPAGTSIERSMWAGGIDANVGYAYQLTPDAKFSARYRIFVCAPLRDWSLNGNALVHGPELALTFDLK